MITRFLLLAVICLFATQLTAQSSIKRKSIEVEKTDDETTVTVTTQENGNTITEVYTGTEAEEWLENHGKAELSNEDGGSVNSISVHIDTKTMEEWQEELEELKSDMNDQLEKASIKVEEFNLDSFLTDLGAEIDKTVDGFQYTFSTIRDSATKAMASANSARISKSYLIEDLEQKKPLVLDNFSIKPNPSDESLSISFTSKESEPVTIQLTNSNERVIHQVLTNGAGQKELMMDISDLNKGDYKITLKQGKKSIGKRLIVQ